MRAHQLDANGTIVNTIVVDSLDVLPDLVDASIGGSIGDRVTMDGNGVPTGFIPAPETPPSQTEIEDAIQASLDSYAGSWGYNDIASACTYVGDPCAKFNAEATVLRAWRSATWLSVEQTDAAIQGGTQAYPAT